jgi:ribonucleoside-triphosphate reductase
MRDIKVIKRDGREVDFDVNRITNVLTKAYKDTYEEINGEKIEQLARSVIRKINQLNKDKISVEEIQDLVEKTLILNKEVDIAKGYILYRAHRTEIREANSDLMKEYYDITFKEAEEADAKRDNANVDGNTAMGTMLQYGAAGSKRFCEKHVLDPKHRDAHKSGLIHIHDMDFEAIGTLTCCQIDIKQLFSNGFSTGHGHLREPQDIMSYAALAAIAIQSNQNDQHGGQSIPNFDYGLAAGVGKTFVKLYKDNMIKAMMFSLNWDEGHARRIVNENVTSYNETSCPCLDEESYFMNYKSYEFGRLFYIIHEKEVIDKIQRFAYDFAKKETIKKTYQAMEGFLHNLNTMHSRAGAQVPFSSINFGTDTSAEGRLVIEQFLLSCEAGLGNGETAIFPISCFKVKEGINYNLTDPNYDLFKLAMRVSAKRLFPNFVFLDAPFNAKYYKPGRPETEAVAMGCRTRVMGSVFPESDGIVFGRGNDSFTSINLPRIAIKYGICLGDREVADMDGFYKELDETIELVINQLLERYRLQCKKKVKNFPFLMGQKVWFGSEELGWDDTLEKVIKHGTLTAGFIGLAETLIALIGKHHGEDKDAQKLGLEIVSHMRQRMDEAAKKYTLNFSLIATPAEGLSGRFVRIDKKVYGEIPGVTDKDYYTNSFHVPVYFNTNACNKIEIEAPYHEFTNAGHITYIELDGDPSQNLEAFEMIIRKMKESNIGYGSINHPLDRDSVCGFNGVIGDRCPNCGRLDGENGPKFERIRRITGYLVGDLKNWNDAKRREEKDRKKHTT